MKSVSTSDPQGRSWRVQVRWLPWAPRWRGLGGRGSAPGEGRWYDWMNLGEGLSWFDEGLGGFVTAILLVVLVVAAVLFVLPLFVFVVEVLIVALVVLAGIGLRVLFRRPWLVDAYRVGEPRSRFTWKTVGLGQSKRAVDEIAQQLSAGVEVPDVTGAQLVEQPGHFTD